MKVLAGDDLSAVAFKVCTALDKAGVTVVLTGGSAATVYAPEAYQSVDLDFVLQFSSPGSAAGEAALHELGYAQQSGQYVHPRNPLTVEFLEKPIAIGSEVINAWSTLKKRRLILHILSPTDCCRDRLAHFIFWNDRAALVQAVAVARNHPVDVSTIRDWFRREGQEEKYLEFLRLARPKSTHPG